MIQCHQNVAIIGTGAVGSAIAFSLITQGVCGKVVLINREKERALGEAMDLQQSIEYLSRNARIVSGDYADCADADIVVITVGAHRQKIRSRLDQLGPAAEIIKTVVEPIMESGFGGYFLVVTNPVDIISYYVYRLSGLPRNQVIGTGTSLDSARLKGFIGELLDVDPRSVHGFTMGEHGDSQFVPWSCVTVGGKPFTEILDDNQHCLGKIDLDKLLQKTVRAGGEIAKRKGTTSYGVASATVGIIKALLYNQNKVIPVSSLLEGEYGLNDLFISAPAILNQNGVKEIVELHLTPDELAAFHRSAAIIRQYIDKLPL